MRITRWVSLLALVLLLGAASAVYAAPQRQQTNGQICVLAFVDQDGNGVRGPDEPLLAGVGFTLSDTSGAKGVYNTDGNSEPYCFGNLAAGQYVVQARPPAGKGEATTPGQWAVSLANGAQYDVAYGLHPTEKPEQSQSQATGSGTSPLGRIAMGLLGVAILGAAGYLAYNILRRAQSQ